VVFAIYLKPKDFLEIIYLEYEQSSASSKISNVGYLDPPVPVCSV
jgi:hypothetical protein